MSLSFDKLVADVVRTLSGFGLDQDPVAFLTAPVTASDIVFQVGDATSFSAGVADVESETVFISSVDHGSNVLTIAPDGRGYYGTAAAAHGEAARVTSSPTWPNYSVQDALNEAVAACSPTLFGVDSTSFTWTPARNTYPVPTEAARILQITTDTIGPSREQPVMNRFSFNRNAPAEFPTGKTVTLEQPGVPGRSVTVVYAKEPTVLASGDAFTDCGLAETAVTAVKYQAASILTGLYDASRLSARTAVADQFDPGGNAVGAASKVSVQFYQRFLMELESERRRQSQKYPTFVHVRTR